MLVFHIDINYESFRSDSSLISYFKLWKIFHQHINSINFFRYYLLKKIYRAHLIRISLLAFDYCSNVLMIPTNDARLFFCNLRCVQFHIVRYVHIHVSYYLSLNINETFKSAVKIRHAKNKGLKVNAWHERKLAENNWAFPRNKSGEEVAIDLFCKTYLFLVNLFSRNSMKQEMNCTPYL